MARSARRYPRDAAGDPRRDVAVPAGPARGGRGTHMIVWLHIGTPKSGTTYLQDLVAASRILSTTR